MSGLQHQKSHLLPAARHKGLDRREVGVADCTGKVLDVVGPPELKDVLLAEDGLVTGGAAWVPVVVPVPA